MTRQYPRLIVSMRHRFRLPRDTDEEGAIRRIHGTFICLATLGVARLPGFRRVMDIDPLLQQRMRTRIAAATALVIIPSVCVAWREVPESRNEASARRYVAENFTFPGRTVVATNLRFGRDSSTVEATLLGRPLPPELLEQLRRRLADNGLERTRLVANQPEEGTIAPEQLGQMVRTGIPEDLYQRNAEALAAREAQIRLLEGEVVRLRSAELPMGEVTGELATLFPTLRSLLYGTAMTVGDSAGRVDSVRTVIAGWDRVPAPAERERIRQFLAGRLRVDSLRVPHVSAR